MPELPPKSTSFLTETLIANSVVRLFGRAFNGLSIDPAASDAARSSLGSQNPLTDQLDPLKQPRLARIYGFSYQGNYFKLADPVILLVHGDGFRVPPTFDKIDLGIAGVEFKDETFADHVLMWAYNDIDFSVRIDIRTGWLQDILLADEMSDANNITGGLQDDESGGMPARSGALARSGAVSRPPRR